ncbi:MAG: penicillin acylase family protein, partial [Nitriliruptoraceae bacterium]
LLGRGDGVGSNSWVVSGDRSASGAPMLANDPHLEPSQPSLWYQVGLRCRPVSDACPYGVTGFSFSGLPGVVIGHTDRAAWGFTNLAANAADLVIERLDGDHHLDGDQRVEVLTRTETIRVAMGSDVEITIRETANGPLISDVGDDARDIATGRLGDQRDRRAAGYEHAVALRWAALQPTPTVAAIPRFARLSSWDDLLQAAALFEVPAQNIVYADVDGHIGFTPAGRVPVRAGHQPRVPLAAWLDEHAEVRTVRDDERPWLLDPPDGSIVAANQPILPRGDAPVLEDTPNMGHRAARIHDLIDAGGRLTVDDMLAIQLDTLNANASNLRRHLLAVSSDDERVTVIQQVVGKWDGHDDTGAPGAAAFNAVWRHVLAQTFHDELPDWAHPDGAARWWEVVRHLLERPASPWWDDLTTLEVTTRDDVLEIAMAEAHRELEHRFSSDPATWRWGAMHRLELEHATFGASGIRPLEWILNRGPFEIAGGKDVVNATGWSASEGYEVDAVPSMRMVVDLGDLDAGRWIQLTGQSGRPFHHHYADQAHLWARGDTVPLVHSERALRDVHWRVLTLSPPVEES